MSNVKNIVNLPLDKLMAHPNNPRKELGDLTELADSIKKSGIMQNLTVVEADVDKYTVIIGHRRCAAAKLAGLETAPCAIVEMDEKEQLATMLSENMQRSDLTIIEQAEGIQLMLDLGESVADVAEQTGLSESTVRRRKKLMELDRAELKAAERRGVTLADYAKLDKLEPQNRDKALKCLGTNEFNWKFRQIKDKEDRLKRIREVEDETSEYAALINADEVGDSYKEVFTYSSYSYMPKPEKPKDCDTAEYVYYIEGADSNYPSVKLFVKLGANELAKQDEKKKEEAKQSELLKKRNEWRDKATNLKLTAYNLRREFIKNISTVNDEQFICCVRFLLQEVLVSDKWTPDEELTGLIWDEEENCFSNWNEAADDKNIRVLTAKAVCFWLEDCGNNGYIQNYPDKQVWKINPELNTIYNFLIMLGYMMSDEEKQMRDGTHPIFAEYPKE